MESRSAPVLLTDGRLVWLRPLCSEDAHRLIDLCQRLSPETRRRRFLRATIMCTPSEAERLATVDQGQRVALATVADSAPDAPIVAVGRFHTDALDRARTEPPPPNVRTLETAEGGTAENAVYSSSR